VLLKNIKGNIDASKNIFDKKGHYADSYNCVKSVFDKCGFSQALYNIIRCTLVIWKMDEQIPGNNSELSSPQKFRDSLSDFFRIDPKNSEITAFQKDFGEKGIELLEGADFDRISKFLKAFFENTCLNERTSKIVTCSKTLHFLFPKLFPPVDVRNTMEFFKGVGISLPKGHTVEAEIKKYVVIIKVYHCFVKKNKSLLKSHLDDSWSSNYPKLIDNLITGKNKEPQMKQ
jgi:hypothetical protein